MIARSNSGSMYTCFAAILLLFLKLISLIAGDEPETWALVKINPFALSTKNPVPLPE